MGKIFGEVNHILKKGGHSMYKSLSQKEREGLLSLASKEQRDFLLNKVKRGRRTSFGNIMLNEKINAIKSVDLKLNEDEKDVVDWNIIDFIDYGKGNRFGKCACGISLRFMFTVQHIKTGKTIPYGKDHLSEFLNIDVKDVRGLIKELNGFDYELDELLQKIESNDYGYEIYDKVSEKFDVSKDIKQHIEANIPLLERQINRLYGYTKKLSDDEWKTERKVLLETEQQRQLLQKEQQEFALRERKERDKEILEASKAQLRFSATFAEIAYSLMLNGVNSALEISHIMINHFGADKRISVGSMKRPYIYIDVLVALSNEVENGNLFLDEESDMNDCIFMINPDKESYSQSKNEMEQQILSLF